MPMLDRSNSKWAPTRKKNDEHTYRCILDSSYFTDRKNILKPMLHWDFDLFSLQRLTSGFPLLYLATFLFEKNKFIQKFNLDFFELQRTFKAIEDLYHETNSYHNALHATDVAQASYCLLKELRVKRVVSSFDFMCSILAAFCHDIDHPGVNQSFIINANQMLSLFYKNSLLENHHANVSISVFRKTSAFKRFSLRRWRLLTRNVKILILATDITRQQEFMNRFEDLNVKKEEEENFQYLPEDVMLIQQIAIKCADISNPCRHWDICVVWANFITEEFFRQGDREKDLDLEVLPTMDREVTSIAKIQIGFIKFLVIPLFSKWNNFMKNRFTAALLLKCQTNLVAWENCEAENQLEA